MKSVRPSLENLLSLLKDSNSLVDAGKKINAHPDTITRWAKHYGIYTKTLFSRENFFNKQDISRENLISVFNESKSLEEARLKLGVTPWILKILVNRYKFSKYEYKFKRRFCPTKEELISVIEKSKSKIEMASLLKVSQATAGRWMKKYSLTEDYSFLRNVGKIGKDHLIGKSYEEMFGVDRAKEIKTKQKASFMKTMGASKFFTKPHKLLKEAMIEANLYNGFSTSELVDFYEIDELNRNKKIAVEIDGDYWHNLPRIKKKDILKDEYLEKLGFKVIRIWEHEINNDINKCIQKIMKVLNDKN